MIATLAKGSAAGGAILLIWSMISWTALPFHGRAFKTFPDEAAAGTAVLKQIFLKGPTGEGPVSGVYLVPNTWAAAAKVATPEERKAAEAASHEAMKRGPILFMNVVAAGSDMKANMPLMMARGFLMWAIASALVTWILLGLRTASFGKRVVVAVLAGGLGGAVAHLSLWNWWSFPREYVVAELLDVGIGWLLAGLALAKITAPRQSRKGRPGRR